MIQELIKKDTLFKCKNLKQKNRNIAGSFSLPGAFCQGLLQCQEPNGRGRTRFVPLRQNSCTGSH